MRIFAAVSNYAKTSSATPCCGLPAILFYTAFKSVHPSNFIIKQPFYIIISLFNLLDGRDAS
jgi:hypothetical protein